MTAEEVETHWNKQVKVLVGKTIKTVNYMSEEQAEEFGWDKRSIEIMFTDGHRMMLSKDDEGNDGGSALTTIDELEVIPTI